jgi:hypothetical protein
MGEMYGNPDTFPVLIDRHENARARPIRVRFETLTCSRLEKHCAGPPTTLRLWPCERALPCTSGVTDAS